MTGTTKIEWMYGVPTVIVSARIWKLTECALNLMYIVTYYSLRWQATQFVSLIKCASSSVVRVNECVLFT